MAERLILTGKKAVRVTTTTWQGEPRMDVREQYQPKDGDGKWLPTKHGVSVHLDESIEIAQAILDLYGETQGTKYVIDTDNGSA